MLNQILWTVKPASSETPEPSSPAYLTLASPLAPTLTDAPSYPIEISSHERCSADKFAKGLEGSSNLQKDPFC